MPSPIPRTAVCSPPGCSWATRFTKSTVAVNSRRARSSRVWAASMASSSAPTATC
ncbi:MAG TPA: hypothetical protein DD399_03505, partial [Alcanivorax sp.]|nr:hypothetical protein [Alcanivorax sp.]